MTSIRKPDDAHASRQFEKAVDENPVLLIIGLTVGTVLASTAIVGLVAAVLHYAAKS